MKYMIALIFDKTVFVFFCTVLLLFHPLGKLCPGVTVLTASLRLSRKSPFPLQAMRKRIHLQVKYKKFYAFAGSIVIVFFSFIYFLLGYQYPLIAIFLQHIKVNAAPSAVFFLHLNCWNLLKLPFADELLI